MSIKVTTIKSLLWFITISLLMLSFPIQIMTFSPLPSLFPYISFFVISLFLLRNHFKYRIHNKNINKVIYVYLFLILFQTTFQLIFRFISPSTAVSIILVFVLPVFFYYYFSKYALESELKIVLIAVSISGLVSGIYYVYDSYNIMVNKEISDFAYKTLDYSRSRSSGGDVSTARVSLTRSHGLLEKHSISSAWVSMGCFSLLALISQKNIIKRLIVISVATTILFIGQNFTAIISFVFVMLFIEFKGYLIFMFKVSKRNFKKFGASTLIFASITVIFVTYFGDLVQVIQFFISIQTTLLFGELKYSTGNDSFLVAFLKSFLSFFPNMISFPPGILIGDGFSDWNTSKGGDFGFADALHRFGLPFFCIILISFYKLIKNSIKKINNDPFMIDKHKNYLNFAIMVSLYVLIASLHYSIWEAKSVLPIIFISIAIFSRYLYPPKSKLSY